MLLKVSLSTAFGTSLSSLVFAKMIPVSIPSGEPAPCHERCVLCVLPEGLWLPLAKAPCASAVPLQQPLQPTTVSADGLTPFSPSPSPLRALCRGRLARSQDSLGMWCWAFSPCSVTDPHQFPLLGKVSLSPAVRPCALASEQGTSPLLTPQAAG